MSIGDMAREALRAAEERKRAEAAEEARRQAEEEARAKLAADALTSKRIGMFPDWFESTFTQMVLTAANKAEASFDIRQNWGKVGSPDEDLELLRRLLLDRGIVSQMAEREIADYDGTSRYTVLLVSIADIP